MSLKRLTEHVTSRPLCRSFTCLGVEYVLLVAPGKVAGSGSGSGSGAGAGAGSGSSGSECVTFSVYASSDGEKLWQLSVDDDFLHGHRTTLGLNVDPHQFADLMLFALKDVAEVKVQDDDTLLLSLNYLPDEEIVDLTGRFDLKPVWNGVNPHMNWFIKQLLQAAETPEPDEALLKEVKALRDQVASLRAPSSRGLLASTSKVAKRSSAAVAKPAVAAKKRAGLTANPRARRRKAKGAQLG